jgi:hypothetical protein
MLVKLIEHYQDARHVLAPGQEVDIEEELAAWLVEHRKAVKVEVGDVHKPGGKVTVVEADAWKLGGVVNAANHPDEPVIPGEPAEEEIPDFEPSVDRKPARKQRGKK